MRTGKNPLVYFLFWLGFTQLLADASVCSESDLVKVTFYGYPDNTPPGPGIRCRLDSRSDCSGCPTNSSQTETSDECGPRGEIAGGTGTYDDPVTMASAGTWFCYQEVVYLPSLRKYLRYEDYCADCTSNATAGILHIDIWTGSLTVDGGALQHKCERLLTPTKMEAMLRNPSRDLPVDQTQLFAPISKDKGLCNGTAITGGATRVSSGWLLGVWLVATVVPWSVFQLG